MRSITGFVLGFLILAVPAFAQSTDPAQFDPQAWFTPACPTCVVTGWVDAPAPTSTVSRTDLLLGNAAFQGWGLECASGQPVDRIDVWVENADQTWTSLLQNSWRTRYGAIDRPDVAAAFSGMCPNVSAFTGWTLYLTNVPDQALGAHRFALILWKGPEHVTRVLTLNVVP
jgi:hypothetical protein